MKKTVLEKDGVRQEVFSPIDVARLKAAGYVEVEEVPQAAKPAAKPASDVAAEQQEIVEDAIQPVKKTRGKKS